jgi:hypothetical protein
MKEPVDHIIRPLLPWRSEGSMTECGLNAASVKVLSRPEYEARLKDWGIQRSAMVTCMTCAQTFERYPDWQTEPRLAIGREVEYERAHYHRFRGQVSVRSDEKRGARLRDELFAIEALISAHPDEFAKLVAEIQARREWNAQKPRPKKPEPKLASWHKL